MMRYIITRFEGRLDPLIAIWGYLDGGTPDVDTIEKNFESRTRPYRSEGIFYNKRLNVTISLDRRSGESKPSFPERSLRVFGRIDDCENLRRSLVEVFKKNKLELETQKQ